MRSDPSLAGRKVPYTGDYLWVNHDKDYRAVKTHRHDVLSHVQSTYRRRKRLADINALASASLQRETSLLCKMYKDRTAEARTDSTLSSSELDVSHPLDAVLAQAEADRRTRKSADALGVIWKGNSDPFNAFAIPVDSEINKMMTFYRDVELPAVEQGVDWADSAGFSHEWHNAQSYLCDEMTALAFLARLSTAIPSEEASVRCHVNTRALSCKTRSMAMLRARTANHQITDPRTYYTTYLLLLAEAYARNCEAARVHATVLTRILELNIIQENFHFVIRTFYFDYHRAAMSNTRLCFDIKAWIPKYFRPYWCRVRDHLPKHVPKADSLQKKESFPNATEMQEILVELGQAHSVLVSSVERRGYCQNDKSRYCRSMFAWILARLHHHHLDAAEALTAAPSLSCGVQAIQLLVQDAFSLAAHCYVRVLVNVDGTSFGQVTIFSANSNILALLRKSLTTYERKASPEDIVRFANIQLWVLYVGSYMEHVDALQQQGVSAEHEWYNTRFAMHVKRTMGFAVWQDVRDVLQTIHYFDGLRPHGSQWFRKTMEANRAVC